MKTRLLLMIPIATLFLISSMGCNSPSGEDEYANQNTTAIDVTEVPVPQFYSTQTGEFYGESGKYIYVENTYLEYVMSDQVIGVCNDYPYSDEQIYLYAVVGDEEHIFCVQNVYFQSLMIRANVVCPCISRIPLAGIINRELWANDVDGFISEGNRLFDNIYSCLQSGRVVSGIDVTGHTDFLPLIVLYEGYEYLAGYGVGLYKMDDDCYYLWSDYEEVAYGPVWNANDGDIRDALAGG